MDNSFIPLLPVQSGNNTPSVNLTTSTAAQNFLTMAPPNGAAAAALAPASTPHIGCAPPKISFQRDGERITHIQIECSCNQIIQLECVY